MGPATKPHTSASQSKVHSSQSTTDTKQFSPQLLLLMSFAGHVVSGLRLENFVWLVFCERSLYGLQRGKKKNKKTRKEARGMKFPLFGDCLVVTEFVYTCFPLGC